MFTFVARIAFPAACSHWIAVAASTVGFEVAIDALSSALFAVFTDPRSDTFALAGVSIMSSFIVTFVIFALITEDALPSFVA